MMLKINKKYAAVFQRKKEAEERFRCKLAATHTAQPDT